MNLPVLWGRESEQAAVRALLERLPETGGALVLRGQPGVGKSSILAYAKSEAEHRGLHVLTVSGLQTEFHLPYVALCTLLRYGCEPAYDEQCPTAIALQALNHLSGAPDPTVLIVDDAQWVDLPSWEALAFIAHRLETEPILLLVGVREGEQARRRLALAQLPELEVGSLPEHAAEFVVDAVAPGLRPDLRARVLAEAAGNPLGLTELARAAGRMGEGGASSGSVSLDTRLERAYRAMAGELPAPTRTLLTVAALNDGDRLDEVLSAAGHITDTVAIADIEPAVAIGLVEVDEAFRVHFRHPLMRSALSKSVGVALRTLVHKALSTVVAEPDRQVWHRALATMGRDSALAAELAQVAQAAQQRGTLATAIAAWERAMHLAEPGPQREAWRIAAATAAGRQGDTATLARLIAEADVDELSPIDKARLAWLGETYLATGWAGASLVPASIEAAKQVRLEGDASRALDLLAATAARSAWANPSREVCAGLIEAAERTSSEPDDPRLLSLYSLVLPFERGAVALEGIHRLTGRLGAMPAEMHLLSLAAANLGALDAAASFAAHTVAGYRMRGQLGELAQALVVQAGIAANMGDTIRGLTASTEGHDLAAESGQQVWAATANAIRAQVAALRGDADTTRDLAAEAECVLLSLGAHPVLALVQQARGIAALAAGRPDEAYEELVRILDPDDIAYHPTTSLVIVEHLADAAAGAGREADLASVVARMTPVASRLPSPSLLAGLSLAQALLSDEDLFASALKQPIARWPFSRARLHLAYGSRLRRQRRMAESRPHLRAAIGVFDTLGLAPWAERARRELRSSGETLRRPADARQHLTPQEIQIATMAAEGHSNREIAARLFLSPRTVGTHLYRIYPKIGVKNRTELARVMAMSW